MEPATPTRKIFFRITTIHIGIVLGILAVGFVQEWQRRQPADEIVTFVSLEPPPPVIENPPQPKIVPPLPELPLKPKKPKPKKPKPKKPKPKPQKKIKVSTNRVKRVQQETLPHQHSRPLDIDKLRESLEWTTKSPTPPPDQPFPDHYFDMVYRVMHQAWKQPSLTAVPVGLVARVEITVQRNGSITKRVLARSSGNGILDSSALKAVQSVLQLEALPEGYRGSSKAITIDFKLTGNKT